MDNSKKREELSETPYEDILSESKISEKLSSSMTKLIISLIMMLLLTFPYMSYELYSDSDLMNYSILLKYIESYFGICGELTQEMNFTLSNLMKNSFDEYYPIINITFNNSLIWENLALQNDSFRYDEVNYFYNDDGLTLISYGTIFDNRLSSILNIARTIYVAVILGWMIVKLDEDSKTHALYPLENIMSIIQTISRDPIGSRNTQRLNGKSDKKNMLAAVELKEINNNINNNNAVLKKQQEGAIAINSPIYNNHNTNSGKSEAHKKALDKKERNKLKSKSNYEVKTIEAAVIKISALLAIGFGEAGEAIIKLNLKPGTQEVNPMVKGRKKIAIFGFCDIRQFPIVNECLQERTMYFVNQIANIVHSSVDYFMGAANKNIGDCFLCVWKFKNNKKKKEPLDNIYINNNNSLNEENEVKSIVNSNNNVFLQKNNFLRENEIDNEIIRVEDKSFNNVNNVQHKSEICAVNLANNKNQIKSTNNNKNQLINIENKSASTSAQNQNTNNNSNNNNNINYNININLLSNPNNNIKININNNNFINNPVSKKKIPSSETYLNLNNSNNDQKNQKDFLNKNIENNNNKFKPEDKHENQILLTDQENIATNKIFNNINQININDNNDNNSSKKSCNSNKKQALAHENAAKQTIVVSKVGGKNGIDQTQAADRALLGYLHIIKCINKRPNILVYRTDIDILNQIPNYKVKMGFGLHIGWAIEGAIGSHHKIDASYLSPNVNMSARLEAATKQYGVSILISGDLYDSLSPELKDICRLIDVVTVKGSNKPVMLYTVDVNLDLTPSAKEQPNINLSENRKLFEEKKQRFYNDIEEFGGSIGKFMRSKSSFRELLDVKRPSAFKKFFKNAIDNYIKGDWEKARKNLSRALEFDPDDGPGKVIFDYIGKTDFKAPLTWKGFRELNSK